MSEDLRIYFVPSQKTMVQFPAPTKQLTTTCNSSPRGSDDLRDRDKETQRELHGQDHLGSQS